MEKTVCLTACSGYDWETLCEAVATQFDALGFDALIHPGIRVVIKPNLVVKAAPEAGIATHPLLTAAVAVHLRDLGAQVLIAESPGGLYTPAALKSIYAACGYDKISKQFDIPLNYDCSHQEVQAPHGQRCRLFPIITPIVEADLVVDIAKMKSHCMTMLSGAVKNLFGTVPGLMKPEFHCRFPEKPAFHEMLVDLCEVVKPSICFVDSIIAMEGNGPTGGKPRFMGVLAASKSPYAVDMACAAMMNMDPMQVLMLRNAASRGLCPSSVKELKLLGDPLESFRARDFLQPESKTSNFIERLPKFMQPVATRLATPYPKIKTAQCIGCGKCAESCPQHTIKLEGAPHKAHIDYSKCIRCYCCHEMCPAHVIEIKRLSLFNL